MYIIPLDAMVGNERIAFGQQRREEAIQSRTAYLAKEREQNARLVAMRAEVERWTPPTSDHEGLRTFMLQQLDVSGVSDFAERWLKKAEDKAPAAYYAEAVGGAEQDIHYHTEEHAKEVERTERRNRWLADLRKSIRDNA